MAKKIKKAVVKKAAPKKKVAKKKLAKKAAPKKKVAKKPAPKKSSPKKSPGKKAATVTTVDKPATGLAVNNVKIRMYCLGTGDCFILKFCHNDAVEFTMMIDCGSCQGGPAEFKPYVDHLAKYVNNSVDLLVVTHEHNDHVNGFAKCEDIFKDFKIGQAWFAWTEDPDDPTGAAKELQKKRSKMKLAFGNAMNAMSASTKNLARSTGNDFYAKTSFDNNKVFLKGLETLAEINLPAAGAAGGALPGMTKIKQILKDKKVKTKYWNPGDSATHPKANGIKFHVLGPPMEREYIFKDGKQGTDVYKKMALSLNDSSLAANSFVNMGGTSISDLPFALHFSIPDNGSEVAEECADVMARYKKDSWRKIDDDWLSSAGSLALRLNSHINNTSLALAIEFTDSEKVLLFPGDAEYGSWESWHEIEKWKPKKATDKHFVEDLLNRTVFYKVGHHLSYNGTALQKGIMMMEHEDLVSMATLDRNRISKGWKSTMPNKLLMQELIKRCKGKCFIMDEFEISNGPSKTLNPKTLGDEYVTELKPGENKPFFIQYNCKVK